MAIFGHDILVARMLSAFAGIATIPLIYLSVRRLLVEMTAPGATALFTVIPLAVLYNRQNA